MIGPPFLRRAAVLAVLLTATATAALALGAPPLITIPPESQRVATGGQATLRVTAIGDGTLAYQWYAGPTGDTAKPIAGATLSSFTTPALTANGAYWVRVSSAFAPAADSATATITVGPVPAASLQANGTTLTVTSANAVATFSGADLVGFVNSLTGEQYLKQPSIATLANVDVITPTGQALQVSNWSVGTESGTGLPLASVTLSDAVRTMTVTVKIDPASQEIVLRSSATVSTAGVRGASWSFAGLDLAAGRWIVPANSGAVFDATNIGVGANIQYPYSWQAQMAVYEAAAGSLLLYSTDSQYRFKQLRQDSRGDTTLDVGMYTEAAAPWRSATTVPTVEGRMKAFAGGLRPAGPPDPGWELAPPPPPSHPAPPRGGRPPHMSPIGGVGVH